MYRYLRLSFILLVLEPSPGAGQRCPNASEQGQCWRWRWPTPFRAPFLIPWCQALPRAVLCAQAGAAVPIHPHSPMELPMCCSHSSAKEQRLGGEAGSDQECELGSGERNLGISEFCQTSPSFVLFMNKCLKLPCGLQATGTLPTRAAPLGGSLCCG